MDSECRLAMMAPASEIQSAVPAAERERRSRRWPRAVVALGTTAALVTAFALTRPRDTELRLRFAGGRTLRYQIDLSVAGTTAVPGGSVHAAASASTGPSRDVVGLRVRPGVPLGAGSYALLGDQQLRAIPGRSGSAGCRDPKQHDRSGGCLARLPGSDGSGIVGLNR